MIAALLTAERSAMPWDDIYAMVAPGRAFNMFFNTASILREPAARLPPTGRAAAWAKVRAAPGAWVRGSHGSTCRRPGGSPMVYGASDLARRLLDWTDDQVRNVLLTRPGQGISLAAGLVIEIEIQRWPEGMPFSTLGRHRWRSALDQPIARVHLADDYLGAWGGMDTAAIVGYEAAHRIMAAVSQ